MQKNIAFATLQMQYFFAILKIIHKFAATKTISRSLRLLPCHAWRGGCAGISVDNQT